MSERQPDIEIYLKRVPVAEIVAWVSDCFDVTDQHQVGETIRLNLVRDNSKLTCRIIENAAKGGYSSVWFEPNGTPWANDEACASAAFQKFQVEVRCTVGGWTEADEDTQGWYRFTDQGRTIVNWLT